MNRKPRTNSDLDKANEHAAKRRRQRERYQHRASQRRQRRDRIRLLALLMDTGVLRSWR